ncbi:zinc knuckle CX2CX4HX4C containing protein [Tanacetum coccineum]
MIRNSPIILKKWTINTNPTKEEFTCIPVWVKLLDVPIHVFSKDRICLIATQLGKPIMLDSYTSSMCIESWGWSSFAWCLIEVNVDNVLKESITMGILLFDGLGFSKETVHVEYEWKPPRYDLCKKISHVHDQCPKNVTVIPITEKMNNDGFQTVVNNRKNGKNGPVNTNCNGVNVAPTVFNFAKDGRTIHLNKVVDNPSSFAAKKGYPQIPFSMSIPNSNPNDLLSQEFDPENYKRSGDDRESEEEFEVVF